MVNNKVNDEDSMKHRSMERTCIGWSCCNMLVVTEPYTVAGKQRTSLMKQTTENIKI